MSRRTIKGPVGRGSISVTEVRADALALREARVKKTFKAKAALGGPATGRVLRATGPLATIVGHRPLPRADVTKKIWAYIKKNNLQDAADKTKVRTDPKLRAVFGQRTVVSKDKINAVIQSRYTTK